MNKKIKVIELLNKIANGEEIPIKIKWNYMFFILKHDSIDGHSYYEKEHGCGSLVAELKTMDDLKSEAEILEDNTEEIKEYTTIFTESEKDREVRDKINELVKAVNEIRKEKRIDETIR